MANVRPTPLTLTQTPPPAAPPPGTRCRQILVGSEERALDPLYLGRLSVDGRRDGRAGPWEGRWRTRAWTNGGTGEFHIRDHLTRHRVFHGALRSLNRMREPWPMAAADAFTISWPSLLVRGRVRPRE